jgi:hypothetical protein
MRFLISIVLTVILSGVFAIPTRKAGEIVKVKPKNMTPIHHMDNNKAGLNNNHHAIVLEDEKNGRLKVTHVSSNPPPPNVHVKSVVGSVDFTGKIHVGHFAVDSQHAKDSNKFNGRRVASDELSKIKLANAMRTAAHDAASKARGRRRRRRG